MGLNDKIPKTSSELAEMLREMGVKEIPIIIPEDIQDIVITKENMREKFGLHLMGGYSWDRLGEEERILRAPYDLAYLKSIYSEEEFSDPQNQIVQEYKRYADMVQGEERDKLRDKVYERWEAEELEMAERIRYYEENGIEYEFECPVEESPIVRFKLAIMTDCEKDIPTIRIEFLDDAEEKFVFILLNKAMYAPNNGSRKLTHIEKQELVKYFNTFEEGIYAYDDDYEEKIPCNHWRECVKCWTSHTADNVPDIRNLFEKDENRNMIMPDYMELEE